MLRYPVKTFALLALFLPLAACPSRAAVSVNEVRVSAGSPYDISYILNTNAASGSIMILNASSATVRTIPLTARDLSKGLHYVRWDGKTDANANAPAGSYTARVDVTGDAVPADGQALWGPVVISEGTNYPSWHGAISVNKNVGSPYYGRIYLADYANDRVAAYSADGMFAQEFRTIGPEFPINLFSSGERGAYVGPDDRLYAYHEFDPAPNRAIVSMKQDGTDFRQEADTGALILRQLVVTGTGDNRRFYFTAGTGLYVQRPGDAAPTTITDNAAGAAAAGGNSEGLAVLDSNNDPTGHANSITIFVRTSSNTAGTSGATGVHRWDANGANPTTATWTKGWSSPVSLGTGFTGWGLDMGPDGNLWTSFSSADVNARGYIKLDRNSGAELDRITGAIVPEKPRSNAVDQNGNVIALLLPDAINATRGRDLMAFAPAGPAAPASGQAAFNVTGTPLPALAITAGPTVNANSVSAKVTWTTNEAATSILLYGSSATSLPNRIVVPTTSVTHTVTIPGLTVLNEYYYQVRSEAPGRAPVMSEVRSFTTKNPPTTISNLQATSTTSSARITWTTEAATDSTVIYGTAPDALTQTAVGTTNTTSHTVTLTGLTPGTTYYFQAQSGSATLATAIADGFVSTLNPSGLKVRTFTDQGQFKFGLMDEVQMTNGDLTLVKKGLPSGVDDAAVADLPLPRMNMAVAAYGGYLYVFGGRGARTSDTVYYAPINPDGTVSAWQETTPMSDDRFYTTGAAFGYNGYLYVVGGGALQSDNTVKFLGTTIRARQNPQDGSLGAWTEVGSFPNAALRGWGAAGVIKGKAYYVGGQSDTSPSTTDIFTAEIKPDGSLGPWVLEPDFAKQLPTATRQQGFDISGNRLYNWGGGGSDTSLAFEAAVNPLTAQGELQSWASSFMSIGRVGMASAILHGYALMVGGSDSAATAANLLPIAAAEVMADGSLGEFTDTSVNYVAALRDLDAAEWQGRLYVVGGRTNADNDPSIDPTGQQTTAVVNFAEGAGFVARGYYESPVMDLGQVEPLVNLAVTAAGAGVTLSVRTAGADGAFGPWAAQSSLNVNFPAGTQARYVQFALDLTGGGSAPVVSSVALTYGTPVSVISPEDARRALAIAGGLASPQGDEMTRLNVAGDATITILDAVQLLKSAIGG